jgi:hypothetical protein
MTFRFPIRITLSLLLIWAPLQLWAQKNIYESEKFDEYTQDHEVLAILPFFSHLELKSKPTPEERQELAKKEGYAVQNALETYFNKRKKRKKFSVTFQNIDKTNALLAKAGIAYGDLDVHTPKELSKLLGVDGIISGNLDLNILLSKGIPETGFSLLEYVTGEANYGRIGIKISDGKSGKLLWKYEKSISKKNGKNTNEFIDDMMKKATRKFPYEREKRKKTK